MGVGARWLYRMGRYGSGSDEKHPRPEPRVIEIEMRVFVCFDEHHHAYGDAIARAIGYSRPRLEVSVAEAGAFAGEVSRLRPEVVISDQPEADGLTDAVCTADGAAAWVEIPTGSDPVSGICVAGRCRRSPNPSFDELLAVVDEAESLTG